MEKRWLLGYLKGTKQVVYLNDFEWQCNWYWAGGYIGNKLFHAHFNGAFLDVPDIRGHCLNAASAHFITPWQAIPKYSKPETIKVLQNGAAIWEDLGFFLDNPQYDPVMWWRIKDLFKQFYALKKAAEVFQHGGHCTTRGRTEQELSRPMADSLNKHIGTVIIPLIRGALNKTGGI